MYEKVDFLSHGTSFFVVVVVVVVPMFQQDWCNHCAKQKAPPGWAPPCGPGPPIKCVDHRIFKFEGGTCTKGGT